MSPPDGNPLDRRNASRKMFDTLRHKKAPQQIIFQIRSAILEGKLRPGDKLPSVRELSETLEISPITVVKAYNELEHLGAIETRRGRGTFVADAITLMSTEDRIEAADELLEETAADLAALDLPHDFVFEMLRKKLEAIDKAKQGGSVRD